MRVKAGIYTCKAKVEDSVVTLSVELNGQIVAEGTGDTKIAVYFCDPHSPWQRGSNENSNGLLRQYFPKNADLSIYTRAELNAVARQLNNRPRQTLGWMKASEVFSRDVASTN